MNAIFGRRTAAAGHSTPIETPADIRLRVSYDRFAVTSVGEPQYDVGELRAQMNAELERQLQERQAQALARKEAIGALRRTARPAGRLFSFL